LRALAGSVVTDPSWWDAERSELQGTGRVGIENHLAEAVQLIQRDFLDPEDIWGDVQALPPYKVAPIIACFEMAFARIAVMSHLLERYLPPTPDRAKVLKAMEEMMETEFIGAGSERVYGSALPDVARAATALYCQHAKNPVMVTAILLKRLSCAHDASAANAYLLERFGNHFCAKALKVWPKSY
jgi:hypothetical protein